MNLMIPDEDFIKVWREKKTVKEVYKHFKTSRDSVVSKAYRLRKIHGDGIVPYKFMDAAFMAKISKKGHAVRYGK